MEYSTHPEPNIRIGRRRTTKAERLKLDAAQNVGVPTSQRRQRQSPDRFTRHMALMRKCIMTEPSSFQEAVQELAWVDSMAEECESIVRNSA